MTPAVKVLKRHKVNYELLSYQHDVKSAAYGLEVVEKLQLNAEQVFKTLVIITDCQQLVVALVPVNKDGSINIKLSEEQLNEIKPPETVDVHNFIRRMNDGGELYWTEEWGK